MEGEKEVKIMKKIVNVETRKGILCERMIFNYFSPDLELQSSNHENLPVTAINCMIRQFKLQE